MRRRTAVRSGTCVGCVVLDGAVAGKGSVIGSGAVVPRGTIVPPHSLVMGVPGMVVKDPGAGSAEKNRAFPDKYVGYAQSYLDRGK
ncbi:MAG: LbetaH domain-containing protein [Desulfobacteria bacterium]